MRLGSSRRERIVLIVAMAAAMVVVWRRPGFLVYPFLLPGVGVLLFLSVLPVSVFEALNEAFIDTLAREGDPAAGRVVIVLGSLLFWGALVSVWIWLRRGRPRR